MIQLRREEHYIINTKRKGEVMDFQKQMRNIALVSAVLLAIVTLQSEGFLQFVFGALSLILVVVGGLYCLPTPQIKTEKVLVRKTETFSG